MCKRDSASASVKCRSSNRSVSSTTFILASPGFMPNRRHLHCIVSRLQMILGGSVFEGFSHGLLSPHFSSAFAFFSNHSSQLSVSASEIVLDRRSSSGGLPP